MILGVLNRPDQFDQAALSAKLRDLTISWSRYAYQESILEGDSVASILDQAAAGGHDYCFVLACGQIIRESWRPLEADSTDLISFLEQWAGEHEFLVAGLIRQAEDGSYVLDSQCLLVDLRRYFSLRSRVLPSPGHFAPTVEREGDVIVALRPTGRAPCMISDPSGAGLIAASLSNGLPVYGLGRELAGAILNLCAPSAENAAALAGCLGQGIESYRADCRSNILTADQLTFLDSLSEQTANARKGVFLWNIESYLDIEVCSDDFQGPITSLYSVAAGFKPNRILHTHGFDEPARVVFFDYSRNALEIKKCLTEKWDGADYPDFIRYLFRKFPDPETYYQLWSDVRPGQVSPDDLEAMWQRELDRWAGPGAFQDHWQAYRRLEHDYVYCDVMAQPQQLIERVAPEPRSVIWWSNSFFTMYGNWFFSLDQRKQMYKSWVSRLAAHNPEMFLYGADLNNSSVNGIQADEYLRAFQEFGGDCLRPCKLHRQQIRS